MEETTHFTGTMHENNNTNGNIKDCPVESVDDPKKDESPDKFSHAYWTKRWSPDDRGWHRDLVNPMLESHVGSLINGRSNVRTFFPLCGMSIDMLWLAQLGHNVVGVEYVEAGVKAFFEDNDLKNTVEDLPGIGGRIYKATDVSLEVYCCDYYDLTVDIIGQFDAIWDRGSLVAIDPNQRKRYSEVLLSLMAHDCRYLLSKHTYDKTKFEGPPSTVDESELSELYGRLCNFELLERVDTLGQKQKDCGLNYFYSDLYLITPKG